MIKSSVRWRSSIRFSAACVDLDFALAALTGAEKSAFKSIDMAIPSYYDAPDLLEGSVPMRGDDPHNESTFQLRDAGSESARSSASPSSADDRRGTPTAVASQRHVSLHSTTGPDARLYEKATGREAQLAYVDTHAWVAAVRQMRITPHVALPANLRASYA